MIDLAHPYLYGSLVIEIPQAAILKIRCRTFGKRRASELQLHSICPQSRAELNAETTAHPPQQVDLQAGQSNPATGRSTATKIGHAPPSNAMKKGFFDDQRPSAPAQRPDSSAALAAAQPSATPQQAASPATNEPCAAIFRISSVLDNGQGMLAARRIRAGECILAEAALLTLEGFHEMAGAEQHQVLLAALEHLPEADRTALRRFAVHLPAARARHL